MQFQTRVINGIEYTGIDNPPDGWEVVVEHTPSHSTTPWEYYGNLQQREYIQVLKAGGIEAVSLITQQRLVNPHGSGAGGQVRMGDDMLPPIYRVAVQAPQVEDARRAIAAHKQEVEDWLWGAGPPPKVQV